MRIQIGAKKIMERLDEMLESAMDGTFEEESYDETELSRLESRWKQYFTSTRHALEETRRERENMKALVSDISHQTRTPLSNILLYGELLEEKASEGEERELARQIMGQTRKLEFLIQALVKMSRLESGVLEIFPEGQSLLPLLQDVAAAFGPKAREKGIELDVRFPRGEVFCRYDRKWTAEAVGNIVDNAIKYAPAGSRVGVSAREFEFYVCVQVKDQGPGIPEEERARIFGRFCRGKGMQQEDGIGIGLYLAREILERQDGYIKVSSREGEGSCFGVYLPRAEENLSKV